MQCLRASDCAFAAQLQGGSRLLKVMGHLYCNLDYARCARFKFAPTDREVPPDMMPNGLSTSEFAEPGL